jgi:hypothetical protein
MVRFNILESDAQHIERAVEEIQASTVSRRCRGTFAETSHGILHHLVSLANSNPRCTDCHV